MEEQVAAGRVKNIGLSNYNIKQIETVLKSARIKPANLQVELHANLQQRDLVNFCKKNNISIVAYCPLGNPSYNDILAKFGAKPREVEVNLLNESIVKQIAAKHSKSPAQVLLKFLLQQDICVIPKSVTPKRIEENLDVYDFMLTDSEMGELMKLEKGEPARLNDFRAFKGIEGHPDYPF